MHDEDDEEEDEDDGSDFALLKLKPRTLYILNLSPIAELYTHLPTADSLENLSSSFFSLIISIKHNLMLDLLCFIMLAFSYLRACFKTK